VMVARELGNDVGVRSFPNPSVGYDCAEAGTEAGVCFNARQHGPNSKRNARSAGLLELPLATRAEKRPDAIDACAFF